ncbi:IpaD/SipD/SspD family type III secretion system needle tip protein [Pseudomonas carnis]|uniref:IpaD/SipD/SspD family type III secretion system needle tip protein n=1 Tax=Pseudomonas TaxID=286 RepID=UPI000F58368A|nr:MULTISPECIES: IpaD/SipD/SspD family type III secretion system needle tip protein [Pseudomonas]AZC90106.1 hypothetical protein C4K29_3807 [Pseudomonas chlororaphis subsp. piscium]MBY8955297.1 IpaD/SipD/SspD family type III secretion system needle tip protein [Pseudomonas carnis]
MTEAISRGTLQALAAQESPKVNVVYSQSIGGESKVFKPASVLEKTVGKAGRQLDALVVRLHEEKTEVDKLKNTLKPILAGGQVTAFGGRNDKYLKAMQALSEARESSHLASCAATDDLEVLCHMWQDSPETKQAYAKFVTDTTMQLEMISSGPSDIKSSRASDSYFDDLLGMIDFIKSDYLAAYEGLLTRYSEFYKEFNEKIMAHMGEWIEGVDDGKRVRIDGDMKKELKALLNKYSKPPTGIVYPPGENVKPVSLDEAYKWADAMGVSRTNVQAYGDGYVVMMDLSPLNEMVSVHPSVHSSTIYLDSAKFQAWQTGFNSLESEMKNQLQLFTTKYGNANSYYENFNKILSSQLSQFSEMLKQMANSFA